MLENHDQESVRKAMTLAAVTGLRNALGPALLAVSEDEDSKSIYAAAAAAEMVIDKIPFMPSRASLPLLIPRAMGGAYVARRVLKNDPWAAALGAVVAAGVASLAPRVRALVRTTLGVPDAVVGLAEDYLALKYGAEAVGMHPGELLEKSGLSDTFQSLRSAVTDQTEANDSPNPAFYRPPAGSPAAY